MAGTSGDDYLKNKAYHAVEEDESCFFKKIQPKGDIC